MRTPRAAALQKDTVLTTAFIVFAAMACPANSRATPSPRESLAGTYRYDPAIRKAHLEKQSTKTVSRAETSAPSKQAGSKPNADTLVLPTMTVRGAQEKPVRLLPRLSTNEPVMNIPVEPFESGEGRRRRLVKKHFTPLEQALGRLLGQKQQDRAGEREAAESASLQLNDVADLIELSALAGLDDPEEQKQLRAEYLKAYLARPR